MNIVKQIAKEPDPSRSRSEGNLPDGPLVAWYGDDFTGAAAVMEVLTFAGLPSMLFLELPSSAQLARFPGLRGIGVASIARTQNPDWMDANLPQVFSQLSQLGAPVVHYKVCSTLDSSPVTGSIGRAMELAADEFQPAHIPILIAAPQIRRYQCFGHLFAGMSDSVFRLDRHPVMAYHPVTPMSEADVLRHLARQTSKIPLKLMSLETLADPDITPDTVMPPGCELPCAIAIDCIDSASETTAGKLIWDNRERGRFVVGSQGIEYALVRHWQAIGAIEIMPDAKGIGHGGRIAVVSGSVSPTTAEQIEWSRSHGFECILFDTTAALGSKRELAAQIESTVKKALLAIAQNSDPLIYTAMGPDDPAVSRLNSAIESSGRPAAEINQIIGTSLGTILYQVVSDAQLSRAIISGGDTSGYATRQLGVFALSALAPTIPGAAIFKTHAEGSMDGLELALKGGQMGSPDYFAWVRDGGGPRRQ